MRRIHLNDTPATTPEHIAHVAHIASVYRPRTEARRRCQEMREAREINEEDVYMTTDWANPDERESAIAAKWAAAEDRIEELESYLRGFCQCPCCEGVEACLEDCTIIEDSETAGGDAEMRLELMTDARRLLYGK